MILAVKVQDANTFSPTKAKIKKSFTSARFQPFLLETAR
jgi:hypothetical protein